MGVLKMNMTRTIVFCVTASAIQIAVAGWWDDILASATQHVSEPITNGFFFWNGAYVPPPYVVEARGTEVLVNGHSVERFASNPYPNVEDWSFLDVRELPAVPDGVTEMAPLDTSICSNYISNAAMYILLYGKGDVLSDFIAAVSRLPNVEHIESDDKGCVTLHPKSSGACLKFRIPDRNRILMIADQAQCYRFGGLSKLGESRFRSWTDFFKRGGAEFVSDRCHLSGGNFSEGFRFLLQLVDQGASDDEIRSQNKNRYGSTILDVDMLNDLLQNRDSLTEEFRRRMFGEYWQTYGVKPETEEERIERVFRDVSYYQRTVDSLLKGLDGMVYNITVRYHGDTNKFTEADIRAINHSRLHYEETLAAKDAYWAALSEADKALMTVKLAQKKADEEAEKNAAILRQRNAAMTNRIAKYERKFRETLSADPDCSSLDEEVLGKICLTKAKAVNVLWKAKDCAGGNDAGKQTIPDSIDELIASTYKGVAVLVGGEDSAKDAWGTIFRYSVMGKEHDVITITSAGPDKRFGTADDIITTEDDW